MSFLGALAKAKAKPGYVVPLIDQYLLGTDISEDRRDRMFHPSDLAGAFCPKAWALYNYHPDGLSVKAEGIEPRTARIFGNGHGVHSRIQGYLAEHLWGRWEKLVGWDARDEPRYETHVGWRPDGNGWRYSEVRLEHTLDRILGSTDGLLRRFGKKWGLEVKSINTDGYKWMPEGEARRAHVNQTLIYMHALEWMRVGTVRPMVDEFDAEPLAGFIVLYENKNDQTLKEIVVPYDPAEVMAFMNNRRELMWEALEIERTGTYPACRCVPGKPSVLCKTFPVV